MPQSSDKYQLDTNIGLLLVGEPGAGKTRVALSFPKPYIVDIDNNLGSALRVWGDSPAFQYDNPRVNDQGKELDLGYQWELMESRIKSLIRDDSVETIIIDSLDPLCDMLIAHILRRNGITEMRIQDWGTFKTLLKKFVMWLRALPKIAIITTHQQAEQDSVTGAVTYTVTMPGSLRNNFGGSFSDVWACEAKRVGQRVKYSIHTAPRMKSVNLKRSLSLPMEVDVTDKTPSQIWTTLKPNFK